MYNNSRFIVIIITKEEDMITIAICDDDPFDRKKLLDLLCKIIPSFSIQCDLIEFESGHKMLELINNIQLVFLDLAMPQLDGIEVG